MISYDLDAEGLTCNHLFSSENNFGVDFDKESTFLFSEMMERVYDELSIFYGKKIAEKLKIDLEASQFICRRAIVPMAFFFFDRLIRGHIAKKKFSIDSVQAQKNDFLNTPRKIEDFEKNSFDVDFNNSFLYLLADILEIKPVIKDKLPQEKHCEKYLGQKNNLFTIKIFDKYLNKLIFFAEFISNKLPLKKIPTLTLANATPVFRRSFFYVYPFREIKIKEISSKRIADDNIRDEIFEPNNEIKSIINILLLQNFHQEKILEIMKIFHNFLKKMYPIEFLEGVKENLKIYIDTIRLNDKRLLITSGAHDTSSTICIGAYKSNKFKLCITQHGGHYGYLKDVTAANVREYSVADYFISWGWNKCDGFNKMKIIPLPSPWLSYRTKLKLSKCNYSNKVIYFPQFIRKIPVAPHGGSSMRSDVLHKYLLDFENLLLSCSEEGIKLSIKFYNFESKKILTEYVEKKLKYINVNIIENLEKGLSEKILNEHRIIIWDQPGTGFLESITNNIPTLVYWTRTYNEENMESKEIFNELESVGVVNSDLNSFIKNLRECRSDPVEWLSNSARYTAINKFINKYSCIDNKWSSIWRSKLKHIP